MFNLLLHGGRMRNVDVRNDRYFERMTRDMADGDTLLWVGFAVVDEVERMKRYEREKALILRSTQQKINIEFATTTGFEDQLQHASVLSITGGDAKVLRETILHWPDFLDLLDGKTVAGSSAGACLFCTLYWDGARAEVLPGLGALPIGLLVHYGSEEFNATKPVFEAFISELDQGVVPLALEEADWVEKVVTITHADNLLQ